MKFKNTINIAIKIIILSSLSIFVYAGKDSFGNDVSNSTSTSTTSEKTVLRDITNTVENVPVAGIAANADKENVPAFSSKLFERTFLQFLEERDKVIEYKTAKGEKRYIRRELRKEYLQQVSEWIRLKICTNASNIFMLARSQGQLTVVFNDVHQQALEAFPDALGDNATLLGTHRHTFSEHALRAIQNCASVTSPIKELQLEQKFFRGKRVSVQCKGSVRADIFSPRYNVAFDHKFGEQGVTSNQQKRYKAHIGVENVIPICNNGSDSDL